MAVLTFRECPSEPKTALRKFVRKMRIFGALQWGWVMEFQTRGVVHFHIFFEKRYLQRNSWHIERITRRGKDVDLVRGGFEEIIKHFWIQSVGDNHPDFLAFQNGGILELLRTPDAAARYVAKEAGKRAQKILPEQISSAGRWWWLSPAGKPKPKQTLTLPHWPYDRPYKLIFDTKHTLRLLKFPERGSTLVVTSKNKPHAAAKNQSEPRNVSENLHGISVESARAD